MRDSAGTTVSLVYLARLREAFGAASERIEASRPCQHGRIASRMARRARWRMGDGARAGARRCGVAVNHDLADADTPIAPGDEVAIFPPVTGG
jgi:molybdopterin synthase sulfur carrier subunit